VTTYSQQVVRSFAWQGSAQAIGQILSWASTIVVIRLLAPGDFGLLAMANVFIGFFFLFADLGLGSAVVQAREIDESQLRRLLGVIVVTHLAAAGVTFGGAPWIAAFYAEPRLTPVLRVLAANFLLVSTYTVAQSRLLRDMAFREKAKVDVLAMTLGAATAVGSAAAGLGVWALVVSLLAMHSFKAVAYNLLRPTPLWPSFSLREIAGMTQFGALVTIDRMLFLLYGQIDVIIGGRVLGKDVLGLYTVALSLAAIPMEKVLPVINQVSFSAYSRIQAEPDRVRRNLLRAVQLVSLGCFPAFLGMAAVAPDFVPVVLGDRWVEMVLPFQLICLILPLKALAALFSPALFGIGRPGVHVVNMAFALAVITLGVMIGVRHGLIGLTMAWVVGYPVIFVFVSVRSLRALMTPYAAFLKQCFFPAAASAAMAAVVIGLQSITSDVAAPIRLGLLIAVGAVSYTAIAWIVRGAAIRELMHLLRG
jgi:teichuronic acid exporter